ncbi:MAG: hypothetical protein WBD10_13650 [Acidobacteriaceae bacterium]
MYIWRKAVVPSESVLTGQKPALSRISNVTAPEAAMNCNSLFPAN